MPKTITFEDALNEGIVRSGDHFLITVPKTRRVITTPRETGFTKNQKFDIQAGEEKIWLLGDELTMVGDLTKEKLTLNGQEGVMEGPDTLDLVSRELHSIPDIFEQVRSCGLTKKDYILRNLSKVLEEEQAKYQHLAGKGSAYWLASHGVRIYRDNVYFCMFYVNWGSVNTHDLYRSGGGADSLTYAVRPEAIPKPTLLLNREGCDGSREKPWKCLSK